MQALGTVHKFIRIRPFIWFLALLSTFQVVAQNQEIDSLEAVLQTYNERDTTKVRLLSRLSYLHNSIDPVKGIKYAKEAIPLAIELADKDGESNAYNSLATNYWNNGSLDLAEEYYKKSLGIKEQLGMEEGAARTMVNLGVVFETQDRLAEAMSYYNRALDGLRGANSKFGEAATLNNMGLVASKMGDYPLALDYYFQSLHISDSINNGSLKSNTLNNIGLIHRRTKEFAKALEAYKESLAAGEAIGSKRLMASRNNNIGVVYKNWDSLDRAIEYYEIALEQYQEINRRSGVASVLLNRGIVYRMKGEQQKALNNFQQSLLIRRDLGDRRRQANVLSNIGQVYVNMGQRRKATEYYLEGLSLAEEVNALREIANITSRLHQNYKALGEFEKAYHYYSQNVWANDSLINEDKIKELVRLESEFEADKERQQLLAAQEKSELEFQKQLERQAIIRNSLIVVTVLILMLGIVYYRSFRRKKRAAELLAEKNSVITNQNNKLVELSNFREGLTSMIAHDMKNPLNSIIGLSESHASEKHLHSIRQSGYQMLNLVTNMLEVRRFEEAEIQLDKEDVNLGYLTFKAKLQVELLLQAKSLKLINELPPELVVNVDPNLIIRVLVNLLTNAIKYSDLGESITLKCDKVENDFVCIAVVDNGRGLSEEEIEHVFEKFWRAEAKASGTTVSTGLGLSFCKMAVEAHGGSISVESQPDKGANFNFALPISAQNEVEASGWVASDGQNDQEVVIPDEKATLVENSAQLKALRVHQVSKINSILGGFEDMNLKSKWIKDLQAAVYQGDQDKYDDLLKMLD